ncbi:hypothetical protein Smp_181630 [Schistosoma mansoni]|uniref:hypothetical protein n=1 Tax=Schistosoma mansoni TaxID=6183 RepID=UPI00022DBFBE|nr:hypothetical protein Smp_181630 [Schistosoma mansoni]|eukprot:XP_018653183.1 hypothetical protein Smp_181630 [Schistosoma mansoni]
MRLHWGVKPFICVFCPYRSAWKGDLKRHMESHHRERFTCETELIKIMSQFKNNAGTRTSAVAAAAAASSLTSSCGQTISQFDITTESSEGDNTSDRYNCLHIDDDEEENIMITTTTTTTTTATATATATTTTTANYNSNSSNNSFSIDVENSDHSSNEGDDKLDSILKSYSRKHSLKSNYPMNSMDPINNITTHTTNNMNSSTINHTNTLSTTMMPNYLSPMSTIDNNNNNLICNICSYHAQNQSKFKNHMASHINLKQFKCPICGQRSNYKWDITKHLKKQHPNSGNQLPITIINNDIGTINEQYMNTSIESMPISLTMYSSSTSTSSSSLPMTSFINSQLCSSNIQSCILPAQSSIVSLIPLTQQLTVFTQPQITSTMMTSSTSLTSSSHLSCLSGISLKLPEIQMTSNDPLNLIAYSSIKQSSSSSLSSSSSTSPSKNSSMIQNDDNILLVNDSLPIDLSIGYSHKQDEIKVKLTVFFVIVIYNHNHHICKLYYSKRSY